MLKRLSVICVLSFLAGSLTSCGQPQIPLLVSLGSDTLDSVNRVNDTIRAVNDTLNRGVNLGPETRQLLDNLIQQVAIFNKDGLKIDKDLLATIDHAVQVLDRGIKVGLDDPTLEIVGHFAEIIDKQPEQWGSQLQLLIRLLGLTGSDLAADVAKQARELSRQVTGDIAALGQTLGQEGRCTVDFMGQRVDQTLDQAGGRLVAGILAALRPSKAKPWAEPLRQASICTILPAHVVLQDVDGELLAAEDKTLSVSGFNFLPENLPTLSVRDEDKKVYPAIRLVPALRSPYQLDIPLEGIDFAGTAPRSRIVLAFKRNDGSLAEYELVTERTEISPAIAQLEASPLAGTVPLTVMFTDRSRGQPNKWLWDFGDGTTDTRQSPTHTFTKPGVFTVKLTVSNARNTTTTGMSDPVQVRAPPPPIAKGVVQPPSGTVPLTVSFRSDTEGAVKELCWSFADGTPDVCQRQGTHVFQRAGHFPITLTATDAFGGKGQWQAAVDVGAPPPPPTASFTASPPYGYWPLTVRFVNTSTATGDTAWFWDFGDGASSTDRSPVHVYAEPRSEGYSVTLTAVNRYGKGVSQPWNVRVSARFGQRVVGPDGKYLSIGRFGGPFGDWAAAPEWCPAGTLAYGYQARIEGSQGRDGDDTGVNGIKLWCVHLPNTQSSLYVTSSTQRWGSWFDTRDCGDASSYLTGARLRIENPLGSGGDDTGAVNVEMQCSSKKVLPGGDLDWGDWHDWQFCPENTAICGLRTKVESDQGKDGDDTALNDAEFYCCYVK